MKSIKTFFNTGVLLLCTIVSSTVLEAAENKFDNNRPSSPLTTSTFFDLERTENNRAGILASPNQKLKEEEKKKEGNGIPFSNRAGSSSPISQSTLHKPSPPQQGVASWLLGNAFYPMHKGAQAFTEGASAGTKEMLQEADRITKERITQMDTIIDKRIDQLTLCADLLLRRTSCYTLGAMFQAQKVSQTVMKDTTEQAMIASKTIVKDATEQATIASASNMNLFINTTLCAGAGVGSLLIAYNAAQKLLNNPFEWKHAGFAAGGLYGAYASAQMCKTWNAQEVEDLRCNQKRIFGHIEQVSPSEVYS